ncbi:MAG: TonB C-terminal domain-containing protein [Mariprofundaceae bacterium]
MSLNLAIKPVDQSTLNAADFIFAGAVHLLVILLIVTLSWWQSISEPKPLKRIEVEMISAKDLAKMQKQKPAVKQKRKKLKPKLKLKPVLKLEKKSKAPAKAAEDNFDPFAPMQSQSDITAPKKAVRDDMIDVMGKQLSKQEIDRYIAMMQQAVQNHWKVPAGVNVATPDPLVEMVLRRNGSVVSAKIIESSGNTSLDQTLISAIYAAAPFQLPKQQFEVFRTNQLRFRPLK